jgi:hypothetical protein
LIRRGIDVFCDESVCAKAKRGISLTEFRNRYSAGDVAAAKKHARENLCPEPIERPRDVWAVCGEEREKDNSPSPMETLDKWGRPIGMRADDSVSPESARRMREDVLQLGGDLYNLPPDEQRKIEEALGRSIDDSMRHPFSDEPQIPVGTRKRRA